MIILRTALWCLSITWALLARISALDAANWMMSNMEQLGERTLMDLCIPGTHDSGMYKLNGGTAFAKKCNTLNQSQTIRKQLQLGIRYFDIRPVISGGRFKTGHYTKLPGGIWQGGNGEFIDSIIEGINDFTRYHKELVIINLSHSLNTDINVNYRHFNKREWDSLFRILDRTENLFYSHQNTNLPARTLGNFTDYGNRAAVLYIVNGKGFDLGDRLGKGFFFWANIQIFDRYSNTDLVLTMLPDQIRKMKRRSSYILFLLSWTLTQNVYDAVLCPLGNSIRKLAKEANKHLNKILQEVSGSVYPNIILVDYVENTDVIETVIAVNNKLYFS